MYFAEKGSRGCARRSAWSRLVSGDSKEKKKRGDGEYPNRKRARRLKRYQELLGLVTLRGKPLFGHMHVEACALAVALGTDFSADEDRALLGAQEGLSMSSDTSAHQNELAKVGTNRSAPLDEGSGEVVVIPRHLSDLQRFDLWAPPPIHGEVRSEV